MPGIFGVLASRKPDGIEETVVRMVKKMKHESFYSSGHYFDDELCVWIGWTSLPGAFSDGMPVVSSSGRKTLIFTGDAIGTPRLEGAQGPVQKAADLMRGFDAAGDLYLPMLNGFFSGLFLDKDEGKANLFIDRFGMNRLYIHEKDGEVYFATEAKCLLALFPETRKFSLNGIGEFFSYGCALNGTSLFENISLLPGASNWEQKKGEPFKKKKYFEVSEWERLPKLSMEDAYEELRSQFREQLPLLMGGEEKVALSLTGGLDTRMILANVDYGKNPFPCYTFGGIYRECYDVKVARKVAAAAGLPYTVIPLDNEFLKTFPELATKSVYITDGGLDLTGVPNLYVNRFAREIAPVRITGNYGSEVLRKHRAFKPEPPAPELFTPECAATIEGASEVFKKAKKGDHLTFVAFKQAPWYQYSRFALEQSQLTTRSPYMDNFFVQAMYRTSDKTSTQHNWSEQLIQDGNPMLGRIMTDRGIKLDQSLLSKVWWRAYHEFSFKMDYYSNHGMTQRMARINHMLGQFSPEKWFLGTHKYYHLRIWFRDNLKNWVREILLDPKSLDRPYLNRKKVEQAVMAHTEGYGNHTHLINKLLTLELAQRSLME